MAIRRKQSKSESVKFGKIVSPVGMAAWAWLTEPNEDMDKEQHKITLFYDPSTPEAQKFEAEIMKAVKQHGSTGDVPIKKPSAKEIESVRERIPTVASMNRVTFRTTPQRRTDGSVIPVPVVDAAGQKTESDVWTGDTIRVQAGLTGWVYAGKKGVSLYLEGVQLIKANRTKMGDTSLLSALSAAEGGPGGDDLDQLFKDE